MKTIALLDLFKAINYNWRQDESTIERICYYTKTRIDPSIQQFRLTFGMEQPFLMKALADYFKLENFFEIGFGRGTASYSISLSKSIKEIHTLDLVPFKDKQETAIGYKRALVSNKDLCKTLNLPEREKIKFYQRKIIQR